MHALRRSRGGGHGRGAGVLASAVLFLAGVLLPAQVGASEKVRVSPFEFTIPDGWTDLSPGAPPANFEGLDPSIVEAARRDGISMVAVDLAGGGDGFAESVNALVVGCPGTFDGPLVDELSKGLVAPEAAGALGAVSAKLVEARLISVGSATGAFILFDLTAADGTTARSAQYHIPGGTKCAILTYSTTPAAYETYAGIFEAAALATAGAADPPARFSCSRYLGRGLLGGAVGGAAGAVIGLGAAGRALVRRARRRRAMGGGSSPDTSPPAPT